MGNKIAGKTHARENKILTRHKQRKKQEVFKDWDLKKLVPELPFFPETRCIFTSAKIQI